jgi:hypothetical protein
MHGSTNEPRYYGMMRGEAERAARFVMSEVMKLRTKKNRSEYSPRGLVRASHVQLENNIDRI